MSLYQSGDRDEVAVMQNRIGHAVGALQDVVEEMEHERPVTFTSTPDAGPLPRTLLRLRHDIVMVARACAEQLPVHLSEELKPSLDRVAAAVSNYLRACSRALISRRMPPPLEPVEAELAAFASGLAAKRQHELADLSASQLERLFTLGFALEQLQRNMTDLARCVRDWAASPQRGAGKEPK
jgi:hypothetical protein